MTIADFQFRGSFSGLTDQEIQLAIQSIDVMWKGVNSMWNSAPSDERDTKRLLVKNYLVAWYLADMFPIKYNGGQGMGGAPLHSKTIGGTTLMYKDMKVQPQMERLTTNIFGLNALQMLQSCPEFYGLYA